MSATPAVVATRQLGLSLIEVSVSLLVAALLLTGLSSFSRQVMSSSSVNDDQNQYSIDAQFALNRMAASIAATDNLLIPTPDNPATISHPLDSAVPYLENIREQSVSGGGLPSFGTAVLAVTLPRSIDFDEDNNADIDTDEDDLVDEDPGADLSSDGAPGLVGIDDDGDGQIDEGANDDDDEDGQVSEDPINGIDDDGDGRIDEDPGADADASGGNDDDNDGSNDEDYLDPLVYFISGDQLIERYPDALNGSGTNYSESVIADNVVALRFERQSAVAGRQPVLTMTLSLGDIENPYVATLSRRVGAAQ